MIDGPHALDVGDLEAYEHIGSGCGYLKATDVAAVEFVGADRLSWLQGQVTKDLRSLPVGSTVGFCICRPSGQLLTVGRLAVCVERVVCLVPATTVPAILGRVEEAVFLEDVSARELVSHAVWKVLGPRAREALAGVAVENGVECEIDGMQVLVVPTDDAPTGGFDLAVSWSDTDAEAWFRGRSQALTPAAAEAARLEAGIPRWGTDMDERVLASEMGPHFEESRISYSKGCYTGQEVLMRIHSRGHTNRTWMGLVAEAPIDPGLPVVCNGEECGRTTSACRSPALGFIAGAMLRNEAAKPGQMVDVIAPTAAVRAEVRHMPLLLAG